MGRFWMRAGWAGAGGWSLLVLLSWRAARGDEAAPPADLSEQVQRAAALRVDGEDAAAEKLLAETLASAPDLAAARWLAGFVRVGGAWVRAEQTAVQPSELLTRYRSLRDALVASDFPKQYTAGSGPSARGDALVAVGRRVSDEAAPSPAAAAAHWQLAGWCRQHALPDEERAHLYQTLQNDSSYLERVAQRLGLVPHQGQLLSAEQLAAARAREVQQAIDRKTWTTKLVQWRKAARSKTAKVRQVAVDAIVAIGDAGAIPAAESLTMPDGAPTVAGAAPAFDRAVVEMLARIADPAATASLVRHAVLAQNPDVRLAAAERLRDRPLAEVAPLLLAGFGWPVQFQHRAQVTPGGESLQDRRTKTGEREKVVTGLVKPGGDYRVGAKNVHVPNTWKDTTLREKWGQGELLYSYVPPTSTYVATLIVEGPGQIVEQNVLTQAAGLTGSHRGTAAYHAASLQLEQSVARYNAELPERNERIAATLSVALGTRLELGARSAAPTDSSDPDEWYRWWYDYNELDRPERKPYVNVDYAVRIEGVAPQAYAYAGTYDWHSSQPTGSRTYTASCFPEGTPILTATGLAAVEAIKIGDRVLSQDCQTGELAYQPVLGTTTRPPAALVTIRTGDATLRSTRGHPFFVVDKGWRMAKELQPGDRLVSLGRLVTVDDVSPDTEKAPAYNLIVADAATYFVGQNHVLVHDNSPVPPSRVALPGYAAAR